MIVGSAITASSIEPFKALRPFDSLNNLDITGPTNTIPRNPITTEGIPANISITGFAISLTLGLAISERYAAVPIPRGIAIISAPMDTIKVLTSIEPIPYEGVTNVAVGFHIALKRKSFMGTSLKTGADFAINSMNIPISTTTTSRPLKRNRPWISFSLKLLCLAMAYYDLLSI